MASEALKAEDPERILALPHLERLRPEVPTDPSYRRSSSEP